MTSMERPNILYSREIKRFRVRPPAWTLLLSFFFSFFFLSFFPPPNMDRLPPNPLTKKGVRPKTLFSLRNVISTWNCIERREYKTLLSMKWPLLLREKLLLFFFFQKRERRERERERERESLLMKEIETLSLREGHHHH